MNAEAGTGRGQNEDQRRACRCRLEEVGHSPSGNQRGETERDWNSKGHGRGQDAGEINRSDPLRAKEHVDDRMREQSNHQAEGPADGGHIACRFDKGSRKITALPSLLCKPGKRHAIDDVGDEPVKNGDQPIRAGVEAGCGQTLQFA
jgi:hypothetical protein